MAKRKAPTYQHKPKDTVNKKAIIWVSSVLGLFVIVIAVLMIFDK